MYVTDSSLPWQITVHFEKYPENKLMRCPSKYSMLFASNVLIQKIFFRDYVEAHLMHSLKEADALKHKSHIMALMQERDHKQLWLGLLHGKNTHLKCIFYHIKNETFLDRFDQFWSANRKLMEHSGGEGFRHIPFRLYAPELTNKPYIQFLMAPEINEKKLTVSDLLDKASVLLSDKGEILKE